MYQENGFRIARLQISYMQISF
ncbi:Protein of unknown function [Bacillus thuringiensis]|uniref:Uncharacterized protein n=1 Tax=Bacillus thuringiensis TaxID=1428 RepID=A0A1C4CUW0_BACTU|nr:Protein of unknown function [Bacillus thuringiensis]